MTRRQIVAGTIATALLLTGLTAWAKFDRSDQVLAVASRVLASGSAQLVRVGVEFGVDGDRLPIHELVLDGDLVSMRGSGWVNLRRELHLDLLANVGRRSLLGTVVGPLSSSKAAALWQIEVNGTASDPQIRRPISIMNSLDKVRQESKEE